MKNCKEHYEKYEDINDFDKFTARRRLSKTISPDKDVESGRKSSLKAQEESTESTSDEAFVNYPVGKPLEVSNLSMNAQDFTYEPLNSSDHILITVEGNIYYDKIKYVILLCRPEE